MLQGVDFIMSCFYNGGYSQVYLAVIAGDRQDRLKRFEETFMDNCDVMYNGVIGTRLFSNEKDL